MNKCHFIGNLVRDPELRTTSGDVSVVNFTIAVNTVISRGEKKHEETAFIDLEAWDKGAEVIAKYFQKGDPIVITDARARTEKWEDKNAGVQRSRLRFRVNEFEFPPNKPGRGVPKEEPSRAPSKGKAKPAPVHSRDDEDEDDRIPF